MDKNDLKAEKFLLKLVKVKKEIILKLLKNFIKKY